MISFAQPIIKLSYQRLHLLAGAFGVLLMEKTDRL